MDEPGSPTTLASPVLITIELVSACEALCITMSVVLDGSTALEKFNKSEPALRSNTSELRIGCIISDSDKVASIASVLQSQNYYQHQ